MIKETYNIEKYNKLLLSKNKLQNIDSIYNLPFYGKVDIKGNIIIPKIQKLTYCSDISEDNVNYAIDFVADAFLEFKFRYEADYKNSLLDPNIFPENLEIQYSYTDIVESYVNYINSQNTKEFPNTLMKYIETYKYFINNTGFAIKIKNFPDFNTIKENAHYEYIKKLASFYGFSVYSRQNTMMIFNIRTSYFRDKVKNNPLYFSSSEQEFKNYAQDFFEQYFYKAEELSYQLFQNLVDKDSEQQYIMIRCKEMGIEYIPGLSLNEFFGNKQTFAAMYPSYFE